jgi:hypothetical protein
MSPVQWIPADWPAPSGIVAGTTCRQGGVSKGPYASLNLAAHVGDDDDSVAVNRRRFVEACSLAEEPAWLTQVHGVNVVRAEGRGDAGEADAIVTALGNRVCAVLTADCLPVLFASADGAEVAAAHAGWRGLCAGVLEATVARMAAPPAQLLAWLGPAVSRSAFEVGKEVREAFVGKDAAAAEFFQRNPRGRWQADLYGLAALRLRNAGVTRVYGGGHCTYAESEAFFSYRRDGRCGRMASFILRAATPSQKA